jgi:hypothetical protein
MDEVTKLRKRLEIRDTIKVNEQNLDLEYYNDTFNVNIKEPFHIVRTGTGSRIINDMVAHIQVANPQVFREARRKGEKSKESALKVEKFLNYLIKSVINEIAESIWNLSLFGEGIFQVDFNGDAYSKENSDYVHKSNILPVLITSVDPLITHCLPYDSLTPDKVLKCFELDASEIISMFPEWTNPKKRQEGSSNGANYISYWNDKTKYFEADKEMLRSEKNIFKFTPFVHFYSGFGMKSGKGKPETLAVGRLRRIRGRLIEECRLESQIDSIISLYANPIYKVKQLNSDAAEADRESLQDIILGAGMSLFEPYGYEGEIYTPDVATAQLFAHRAQVQSSLEVESPTILSGVPQTSRSTGRQEDIEYGHIQRKYARLIHNLEESLSAVLGMALRILDTVPQALPVYYKAEVLGDDSNRDQKITKDDIEGFYDCEVKLNPDEELENTIDFQKYRILVNEGRISWKEFLIKGCKKTESEAEDIMAEAIAEQTVVTNPQMNLIRVQDALEKMGMDKYKQLLEQQITDQGEMNTALQNYQTKQRPSEARNPAAAATVRQVLNESPVGIRSSPNG